MAGPQTIHGSCIVIGECGVLIRGPSGAGKSRLVRDLLAHFQPGCFARLVADDRVALSAHNSLLLARAHPLLAGQIEQRGIGILVLPHEDACIVRLIVDLDDADGARMPLAAATSASLAGVTVERLPVSPGADAVTLVAQRLARLRQA